MEAATNKVTEAQSTLADTQSEYDELIGKTEELTVAEKKRLEGLKETREEQEKHLADAQHERWERWNNIYGSGASAVVGGMDAHTGGMATGAVQMERMDIVALQNYREELEAIEAQYRAGELSAGAYYDALEQLNAAREEIVETIRAAILAGYEVTDEQRDLVAAYDNVSIILGKVTGITYEWIASLIDEAKAAGTAENALYDTISATKILSNTQLNLTQQMQALAMLRFQLEQTALQAAYTAEKISLVGVLTGTAKNIVSSTVSSMLDGVKSTGASSAGSAGAGSGTGSSSSGSTSSAKSRQNELDNAKKKAAQATIDAIKKQMDAETDAIDEQIDALKKRNEEEDRSKKLEELKLDILKKQDALLNARNERTVRQYNAATGQWEWVADPEKVRQAQEDLENAKKDLRDYERDTERELAIEELEARKKAIEAAYQLKIDGWQKFIDELNGDVETEAALLAASIGDWDAYYEEMLKVYQKLLDAAQDYEDKKQEIQNRGNTGGSGGANPPSNTKPSTAGAVAGAVSGGAKPPSNTKPSTSAAISGAVSGGAKPPSGKKPSGGGNTLGGGKNINRVSRYDSGGVLKGLGGIKATVDDEMVLPPDITAKMLRPSANAAFQARMRELGSLYDSTPVSQSVSGVVNNDRHDVTNNYSVNGVTLNPQDANRPFSDVIEFLADAAHHMRPFSGM